jgi:hypothetical protein
VICVGDFFGPTSEESDTQFEDLLVSRTARSSSPEISHIKPLTHDALLIAPLTTDVITGILSLPEKIQRKVEEMGERDVQISCISVRISFSNLELSLTSQRPG